MARTKKVGFAGKFGTRYGRRIRQRLISTQTKKNEPCPSCLRPSLNRVSVGIWECKKCGFKKAGKAFKPAA